MEKATKNKRMSELMRIFGVGRSTVREAVKILVNMGFLKVQQGAGTFVESRAAADDPMAQRLRRADIRDLDEVRRILEVAIVERAAGSALTAPACMTRAWKSSPCASA